MTAIEIRQIVDTMNPNKDICHEFRVRNNDDLRTIANFQGNNQASICIVTIRSKIGCRTMAAQPYSIGKTIVNQMKSMLWSACGDVFFDEQRCNNYD